MLFVIGASVEPGGETHSGEASEVAEQHTDQGPTEGGEVAGREARERTDATGAEGDEGQVLGVDVESPASVAVAVLTSMVLAASVLWRPGRRVFIAVAVVAALFALLDALEVGHQLREDDTGLAVLAAAIAVLHAAAAALALWSATRPATVASEPVTP